MAAKKTLKGLEDADDALTAFLEESDEDDEEIEAKYQAMKQRAEERKANDAGFELPRERAKREKRELRERKALRSRAGRDAPVDGDMWADDKAATVEDRILNALLRDVADAFECAQHALEAVLDEAVRKGELEVQLREIEQRQTAEWEADKALVAKLKAAGETENWQSVVRAETLKDDERHGTLPEDRLRGLSGAPRQPPGNAFAANSAGPAHGRRAGQGSQALHYTEDAGRLRPSAETEQLLRSHGSAGLGRPSSRGGRGALPSLGSTGDTSSTRMQGYGTQAVFGSLANAQELTGEGVWSAAATAPKHGRRAAS